MTQPKGYMVIVDPGAAQVTREWDTITCHYCNRIVRVKADPGGFCRLCMRAVCGPCADQGSCTPFEKRLDEYEKAAARGRVLDELLRTG